MNRKFWIASLCFALCAVCFAQQQQQKALTNASVVKMVKAGLSESIIVPIIMNHPGDYTMTPAAVTALKQAGVTSNELAAMAMEGTTVAVSEQPQSNAYSNLEIGVYYKLNGKWTMLPSEQVTWKTGGVMKMLFSDGIVQNDVNGFLDGAVSPVKLTSPLELLIETPDGFEGTDFQLIYLQVKRHAREFRMETGGAWSRSGGTQKDAVPFKQKKIARYTYEVILPPHFIPGEYAFLPPHASIGSAGKAYTFHFVE